MALRPKPLLFRTPRHRRLLSPETFTKVGQSCASKAITKESDESDSSSSTVLIESYKSTAAVPESGTRS